MSWGLHRPCASVSIIDYSPCRGYTKVLPNCCRHETCPMMTCLESCITASMDCNIFLRTCHHWTIFMLAAIRSHMIATSCCIQQHSLGPQHLAAACWSGVYNAVPVPVLLQQVQVLLQTLNLMAQCSTALFTRQPASPIARVAIPLCGQCLLVRCPAIHPAAR